MGPLVRTPCANADIRYLSPYPGIRLRSTRSVASISLSLRTWVLRQQFKWCTHTVSEFYLLTGRPLVWWGERIEHGAVRHISDFAPFRVVVSALVAATTAAVALSFRRLAMSIWMT